MCHSFIRATITFGIACVEKRDGCLAWDEVASGEMSREDDTSPAQPMDHQTSYPLDFECTPTSTIQSMTSALTIQQAAAACGLTVHTLRYYERIGLIRPVPRRGNGHRRYRADDMGWIAFLLRLRATGMSVEEMQRYARLRDLGDDAAGVAERKRMLEVHAQRVEADRRALDETLAYLHHKISLYDQLEHRLKGAPHDNEDRNRTNAL